MDESDEWPPIGSVARARVQLARGHLDKALRTLRVGGHEVAVLRDELREAVERLIRQRAYGPVLSAYYFGGQLGSIDVDGLLRRMHAIGDHAGFLKQAVRFSRVKELAEEIEASIRWHEASGLNDAGAWRRKVEKLRELDNLRSPNVVEQDEVQILADETSDNTSAPSSYRLRPLRAERTAPSEVETVVASGADPYIVSQVARVKLERANREHRRALNALVEGLAVLGVRASESRLLDAHAVVDGRDAIFEVKSITEANERDQVRHAISQLYEYRFLHRMRDASLWIVFACRPFSDWYVEYLLNDRQIGVLWITDGRIDGPSVGALGAPPLRGGSR